MLLPRPRLQGEASEGPTRAHADSSEATTPNIKIRRHSWNYKSMTYSIPALDPFSSHGYGVCDQAVLTSSGPVSTMDFFSASNAWFARLFFERGLALLYLVTFVSALNQFPALPGNRAYFQCRTLCADGAFDRPLRFFTGATRTGCSKESLGRGLRSRPRFSWGSFPPHHWASPCSSG